MKMENDFGTKEEERQKHLMEGHLYNSDIGKEMKARTNNTKAPPESILL